MHAAVKYSDSKRKVYWSHNRSSTKELHSEIWDFPLVHFLVLNLFCIAWGLHADRCLELIFFFLFFFFCVLMTPLPSLLNLIEVDNDCADILNRLWLSPMGYLNQGEIQLGLIFFSHWLFPPICEYHMNSGQCVSNAEINLFSYTVSHSLGRKNTDLGIIKHKYVSYLVGCTLF